MALRSMYDPHLNLVNLDWYPGYTITCLTSALKLIDILSLVSQIISSFYLAVARLTVFRQ